MKTNRKLLLLAALAPIFFAACDKSETSEHTQAESTSKSSSQESGVRLQLETAWDDSTTVNF